MKRPIIGIVLFTSIGLLSAAVLLGLSSLSPGLEAVAAPSDSDILSQHSPSSGTPRPVSQPRNSRIQTVKEEPRFESVPHNPNLRPEKDIRNRPNPLRTPKPLEKPANIPVQQSVARGEKVPVVALASQNELREIDSGDFREEMGDIGDYDFDEDYSGEDPPFDDFSVPFDPEGEFGGVPPMESPRIQNPSVSVPAHSPHSSLEELSPPSPSVDDEEVQYRGLHRNAPRGAENYRGNPVPTRGESGMNRSAMQEESPEPQEELLSDAIPFDEPNATVLQQPAGSSSRQLSQNAAGLRKMTYPPAHDATTTRNADPFENQLDRSAMVSAPMPPNPPEVSERLAATGNFRLQNSNPGNRGAYANPPVKGPNPGPNRGEQSLAHSRSMEKEPFFASAPREPIANGVPGPETLEGAQSPQLIIEKLAPKEVRLNQPATFKTIVRNIGLVPAKEVVLKDLIPKGTKLHSTNPNTEVAENGELSWSLGKIDPKEEVSVEMEIVPLVEGEIGSIATVQFSAEASVKTVATQPMLNLEISSAPEVLIGENITYNIILSNPGTGTASGVAVSFHVPEGLKHEVDNDIIYEVGELKPGESKTLPLTLKSVAPGIIHNQIYAKARHNLEASAQSTIEVLAPDLSLGISGPKQRYLNRRASYTLTVENPGTATANDVGLVLHLPSGLKFEKTNQSGIYEKETHSVHWALEELPAQGQGEMELILIPTREGDHSMRFEGLGLNHLKAECTHLVSVRGVPALAFDVVCLSDPVEVGRSAVYEVKVSNRGTKSAKNVNVAVRLPSAMQYASAQGPTKYRKNNTAIQFDPLVNLEPNQEKTYTFSAKCLEIGDHRISVSVSSEEQKNPITKEESTLVYGD